MVSRIGKRVLVYGGDGALGRAVIQKFKGCGWETFSADYRANNAAHHQINLDNGETWSQNTRAVQHYLSKGDEDAASLDCVVSVAGGWQGGAVSDPKIFEQCETMWRQNIESSVAASFLASHFLKPSGLLVLTGAAAALGSTPDMVAYGMTKSAVHSLTRTLADKSGGLPQDATACAILPVMIDTPSNRKAAGVGADHSQWTPTSDIARQVFCWATDSCHQAQNGGLYIIETDKRKSFVRLHDKPKEEALEVPDE